MSPEEDTRVKIVNVYELAIRMVDDLATSNVNVTPAKVWGVLQKMLDEKYPEGWCGIKEDAAKRVIFGRF